MRLTGTVIDRCRTCNVHPQRGTDKMCIKCRATLRIHPDLTALAEFVKRMYESGR